MPLSPCREYNGYRNKDGYGYPTLGERKTSPQHGRKSVLLHRWVMEKALGRRLARAEVVRHRCDNPACFLLEHLELGTQADNLADMHRRGRRPYKLTAADVDAIRASTDTQRALARRFGVSQNTIGQVLRGQRQYAGRRL